MTKPSVASEYTKFVSVVGSGADTATVLINISDLSAHTASDGWYLRIRGITVCADANLTTLLVNFATSAITLVECWGATNTAIFLNIDDLMVDGAVDEDLKYTTTGGSANFFIGVRYQLIQRRTS